MAGEGSSGKGNHATVATSPLLNTSELGLITTLGWTSGVPAVEQDRCGAQEWSDGGGPSRRGQRTVGVGVGEREGEARLCVFFFTFTENSKFLTYTPTQIIF